MNPNLIALAKDDTEIAFVKEICQINQFNPVIFADVDKTIEYAKKAPSFGALLFFFRSTSEIAEVSAASSAGFNPNLVHAICSGRDPHVLERAFASGFFGHIGIKNTNGNFYVPTDVLSYARIVKLSGSEFPFGLNRLLEVNTEIQSLPINESSQRVSASGAVAYYLQERGCSEYTSDVIATAADELLMNAIYDSQVGKPTSPVIDCTSDKEGFAISGVNLNAGVDNKIVAINVIDSNGTLDRAITLRQISKITQSPLEQANQLNRQKGAGIGLAMVVRSGGSLLIATSPGQRTEVTAIFKVTKSFKEMKSQFQFISTIVVKNP